MENQNQDQTQEIEPEIMPLTYRGLYDFLRNSVEIGHEVITLFNLEDGGYYRLIARNLNTGKLNTEEEEGWLMFIQRVDSPITS